MPKKSTRDSRSIERTGWKPKTVKRNSNDKRIVNNIYIGAGNARRWIILKKKLDYQSDVDFVAYLLDLAEPQSVKGTGPPKSDDGNKKDDDKDHIPVREFEEDTNDSTSSVQHEISDDGEWRPFGTASDGPLRRSPRKQSIPVRIHVRRSARNMVAERRQFKKDENAQEQAAATVTEISTVIDEVDAAGAITTDESFKTEIVQGEEEKVPLSEEVPVEHPPIEKKEEEEEPVDEDIGDPRNSTVKVDCCDEAVEGTGLDSVSMCLEQVRIEVGERVKLKRRKKKRNHNVQEPSIELKSSTKHKRKKHRHGEHSTKKKHHDIRKAPQDGIPQDWPQEVVPEIDCRGQADRLPGDQGPKCSDELELPHPQQRVAIRIKLCCDCNSRHVQDACPLRSPAIIIGDAVIYGQWQSEKKQPRTKPLSFNGEGTPEKVSNTQSDSMNGMISVSNTEVDGLNKDDTGTFLEETQGGSIPELGHPNLKGEGSDRSDCTTDVKLFAMDASVRRLSFAEASLPVGLELQVCDPSHGLSVVARCHLRQYTQFGPLVGQPIKEMDIPDDFSMKDIWEVLIEAFTLLCGIFHYLSETPAAHTHV